MAGDSVIGALRVVLGLDTADLDKGLKSSQGGIATFADSITKGMAAAAATFATAAGAMGLAIQGGLAQADKMGKAAQKMGIPVEELSKLQHAANLSDVSLEQLGTGVTKLSRNLVEGVGNPSTAAARSLAALGISAKDSSGQLRPTSDVISDIAEKFSGMKDGAGKTALAMNLFGKSGAELIPMLNSGKTGLQEMKDEAEKLGLTITDKTAKAAEQFNDDLTRLKAAKEGVVLVITSRLAPALSDISARFVNFTKDNNLVMGAADGLTRAIMFVADNIKVLGNVMGIFVGARIVASVAGIALSFITFARAVASATLATTLLNAAKAISIARIAAFAGVIIYATGNMPAFVESLEKIGKAAAGMLPQGVTDTISAGLKNLGLNTDALTKDIAELGKSGSDAADALKKLNEPPKIATESEVAKLKQYQTQLASLGLQTRVAKGEFDQLAPGFAAAAMQLGLFGDKGQKAVTTVAALTPQMALLNTAMLANAAAMAVQSIQSPYERLQSSLAQYDMMLKNNMLTVEQHKTLSMNAAESVGATWDGAISSMAGGFAQLANQFGKSSKEMAIAGKAFGIIEATINTYTAFTKALASAPPPFNYALAAGVLAAGMAKVAAISSTPIPSGYMTGGSFTVGGSGGPDSTPVSFMASPGEQVDIWRPDQGGGADPRGRGGGTTIVNLSMPIATTRDALRDIIEGLNGMFSDGYQLKVQPV